MSHWNEDDDSEENAEDDDNEGGGKEDDDNEGGGKYDDEKNHVPEKGVTQALVVHNSLWKFI